MSEKKVVYVVHSNGKMYMCATPASAAVIPEMENTGDSRAIHVFDASASVSSEPAQSNAFLILTSSRNNTSYKQTERRPVHRCVIPSYTMEELQLYCLPFNVTCEEVALRSFQIGPSFRYILTGNYDLIRKRTEENAKKVTAEQLDLYLENPSQRGDSSDISACLVIVIVSEEDYEDPNLAYTDENVTWKLASQSLTKIIIQSIAVEATKFVRNFITRVNAHGLTKLKGFCGNFFELIVDDVLRVGTFSQCRELTEPITSSSSMEQQQQEMAQEITLFSRCDRVVYRSFVDIPSALRTCGQQDTDNVFFSFCGTMPAIDFATAGFLVCFQATTADKHNINFDGISAICEHARTRFGVGAVVNLVFVVPDASTFAKWKYTQSFTYTESVSETTVYGDEQLIQRKRQSKFGNLPPWMQDKIGNLRQMVVCAFP